MDTNKELEFYKSIVNIRDYQANVVFKILSDYFNFENIECIETGASQNLKDGCFGLYLSKICESHNGVFSSVDIDENISNKSNIIYDEYLPNFKINTYISDSIKFLKEYDGTPNLVHLDSYDLDLKNPIPSMLHSWLEFDAIKGKMPSGSIIMVDDNYLKGTWVDWNISIDGEVKETERIDIDYDIIGKGSLIYYWCKKDDTDWDIIGDHYHPGLNIKIIIKKR